MSVSSSSALVVDSKKQFSDNIQKWVLIDTQIKYINEKTRQLRESRSNLIGEIYKYVNEKKIANNKIEITDGQIVFFEKREYPPLTYTYIEKCLAEIIPEKTQVEYIIQYLKSKREIKSSPDIRRIDKK
jgi:hypothetical protein